MAVIMFIATLTLMITAAFRSRNILNNDSDEIILRSAAYHAGRIDDRFRSA